MLHQSTPLTGTLNYGIIQADGTVSVCIFVDDHRVMDGSPWPVHWPAWEGILNGEIIAELGQEVQGRAA